LVGIFGETCLLFATNSNNIETSVGMKDSLVNGLKMVFKENVIALNIHIKIIVICEKRVTMVKWYRIQLTPRRPWLNETLAAQINGKD